MHHSTMAQYKDSNINT